jgi:hypothetical protein
MLQCRPDSLPLLFFPRHEPFRAKVVKKLMELPSTLFRTYLIFIEQRVPKLLKTLRLLQLPPDRARDIVEAETLARVGVEGDQLVAKLGFHELGCALEHGHSLSSPRSPARRRAALVSPAGFEPATY